MVPRRGAGVRDHRRRSGVGAGPQGVLIALARIGDVAEVHVYVGLCATEGGAVAMPDVKAAALTSVTAVGAFFPLVADNEEILGFHGSLVATSRRFQSPQPLP